MPPPPAAGKEALPWSYLYFSTWTGVPDHALGSFTCESLGIYLPVRTAHPSMSFWACS